MSVTGGPWAESDKLLQVRLTSAIFRYENNHNTEGVTGLVEKVEGDRTDGEGAKRERTVTVSIFF